MIVNARTASSNNTEEGKKTSHKGGSVIIGRHFLAGHLFANQVLVDDSFVIGHRLLWCFGSSTIFHSQ